MIYLLFAIAGFMAIVTAFILNSIKKDNKYKTIYHFLVIMISLIIFVGVAVFLFQQKNL